MKRLMLIKEQNIFKKKYIFVEHFLYKVHFIALLERTNDLCAVVIVVMAIHF